MSEDPFAAIAEPSQQPDPFAAIAEDPKSSSEPSLWQTMKNNFNANTQGAKPGDGPVKGFIENVGQGGGQAIRGLKQMIMHPQATADAEVNSMVYHPKATLDADRDALYKDPSRFIGNAVGQLGAGTILGDLGGKTVGAGIDAAKGVARVIPKTIRTTGEAITETSPHSVAEMVRKTSADNLAETAKAADKNEVNASQRKVDLKDYFDKKSALNKEKIEAQKAVSRKEAARRGVEKADEPLRSDLEKTLEKVKSEADERYNTQRKELNDKQIPFNGADAENPEAITSQNFVPKVTEAWDSAITGSESRPALIKSIESRVNSAEPLTWKDYQGYRAELSKKISSGTLPGDEYYGYKKVLGVVDDAMQKIADHNGLGKQVAADRAFYRQYMETFRDPKSPVYKALKAQERGGTVDAFRGADRTGIEAVARYDPALARRIASVRDVQEIASSPVKAVPSKGVSPLAPKKPEVVPNTTTLTPETLSAMKGKAVTKAAEQLRSPNRLASTFLGYDLMRNAFDALGSAADFKFGTAAKQLLKSVRDVGIRVGYSGGAGKIADLIERPDVRAGLSQITPADILEISRLPPDQQAALGAEFQPLIAAARAKGVPVSSSLLSWVGASTGAAIAGQPRKGVAAALTAK